MNKDMIIFIILKYSFFTDGDLEFIYAITLCIEGHV